MTDSVNIAALGLCHSRRYPGVSEGTTLAGVTPGLRLTSGVLLIQSYHINTSGNLKHVNLKLIKRKHRW